MVLTHTKKVSGTNHFITGTNVSYIYPKYMCNNSFYFSIFDIFFHNSDAPSLSSNESFKHSIIYRKIRETIFCERNFLRVQIIKYDLKSHIITIEIYNYHCLTEKLRYTYKYFLIKRNIINT